MGMLSPTAITALSLSIRLQMMTMLPENDNSTGKKMLNENDKALLKMCLKMIRHC